MGDYNLSSALYNFIDGYLWITALDFIA